MTSPEYTDERKSNEARMESRLAKMQSKIHSSIRVRKIQEIVVLSIYAAGLLYWLVLLLKKEALVAFWRKYGEVAKTNKKTEEKRQKKTPESLERDSGEDEANNAR